MQGVAPSPFRGRLHLRPTCWDAPRRCPATLECSNRLFNLFQSDRAESGTQQQLGRKEGNTPQNTNLRHEFEKNWCDGGGQNQLPPGPLITVRAYAQSEMITSLSCRRLWDSGRSQLLVQPASIEPVLAILVAKTMRYLQFHFVCSTLWATHRDLLLICLQSAGARPHL